MLNTRPRDALSSKLTDSCHEHIANSLTTIFLLKVRSNIPYIVYLDVFKPADARHF